MAANGISTLPSKLARKLAKISLAEAKRQLSDTIGFRVLNDYTGSVSPTVGRPWAAEPLSIDGGTAITVLAPLVDGGNSTTVSTSIIDGGLAASTF